MSNNLVILDGWLFVRRAQITNFNLADSPELIIEAQMLTDKPYLGGKHPITLRGKPAQIVQMLCQFSEEEIFTTRALVEGRLLSHGMQSRVDVRYITILGLERQGNA